MFAQDPLPSFCLHCAQAVIAAAVMTGFRGALPARFGVCKGDVCGGGGGVLCVGGETRIPQIKMFVVERVQRAKVSIHFFFYISSKGF